MAKKSKSGLGGKGAPATTKGFTQKLGSPTGMGAGGMEVGSKLEKAATLPYRGISMPGVSHGKQGALAGTGGSKSASIPNHSGSLGKKSSQ